MQALRAVTVAFFLLLGFLPAIQMALPVLPELLVDEQRQLAPPPATTQPLRWPREANAWFSDHFGLRSLLIRLKGQLDYSLFGQSDRVLVGRGGYLWYTNVLRAQKPQVNGHVAVHHAEIAAGIRRYAAALREAGIGTVVVVNQMGDHFLPEMLPEGHAAQPPLDAIEAVTSALAAAPELRFVDSSAILRRTMAERPVFHRTDFHWNDAGAFPVAEAIVAEMSRGEGHAATVWRHPLRIERRPFSGGVARFMPVLRPPGEIGLFVGENWSWPPGFRATTSEPPYEFVTRSTAGPPDVLGPTVLLGDSFTDGLWRAGLGAYLSESYRIRWRPAAEWKISEITEAIPADVRWMLIQFIEINASAMQAFADRPDMDRAVALLAARPRRPS